MSGGSRPERSGRIREERILTDEETAAVFARLEDPHLVIGEIRLDTGTRVPRRRSVVPAHSAANAEDAYFRSAPDRDTPDPGLPPGIVEADQASGR